MSNFKPITTFYIGTGKDKVFFTLWKESIGMFHSSMTFIQNLAMDKDEAILKANEIANGKDVEFCAGETFGHLSYVKIADCILKERRKNDRIFYHGTASEEFFELWRNKKEVLKLQGFSLSKFQGQWYIFKNDTTEMNLKKAEQLEKEIDKDIAELEKKINTDKSIFIGEVGERRKFKGVIKSIHTYKGQGYGYYDQEITKYITKLSVDGKLVVYFGDFYDNEVHKIQGCADGYIHEVGEEIEFYAKIKKHELDKFENTSATYIQRPTKICCESRREFAKNMIKNN